MSKGFEWRDRDGAGFFYGFYREGDKQYHLDIACPGYGGQPKGRDHRILVDGEQVGTAPSLEAAQQFLAKFFEKGLHKNLGREDGAEVIDLAAKRGGR